MVIAGVLINKWIMLPFYMSAFHMDMQGIINFAKVQGVDSEWKLLLMVTGPFNLLKGVVLSVVTGLVYKPAAPEDPVRGEKGIERARGYVRQRVPLDSCRMTCGATGTEGSK